MSVELAGVVGGILAATVAAVEEAVVDKVKVFGAGVEVNENAGAEDVVVAEVVAVLAGKAKGATVAVDVGGSESDKPGAVEAVVVLIEEVVTGTDKGKPLLEIAAEVGITKGEGVAWLVKLNEPAGVVTVDAGAFKENDNVEVAVVEAGGAPKLNAGAEVVGAAKPKAGALEVVVVPNAGAEVNPKEVGWLVVAEPVPNKDGAEDAADCVPKCCV